MNMGNDNRQKMNHSLPASTTLAGGQALPRLLVSPRECAKILSLCEKTVWNLTKRGEIPCLKIGRSVRYSLPVLEAWVKDHSETKLCK